MRAPVLSVPLVAFVPLQPPEAVHEVALVELHVRVDVPPLGSVVGAALRAAVGDCPLFAGFMLDPQATSRTDVPRSTELNTML